ncbi:MAG: hypothetical protein AB203_03660 [Parcubacteria bacterium C7867-008]|nr:MAG: hypothetical protein AB203_03660 [Parcubacteria bacterium C7867-008]
MKSSISIGVIAALALAVTSTPVAHAIVTNYQVNVDVPGVSVKTVNGTATVKVDGVGTVNGNGTVDINTGDMMVSTSDAMVNVQTPGLVVKTTGGADVNLGYGGQTLSTVVESGVDASSAKTIASLEGNAATYIKTQEDVDAYGKIVVESTPQVQNVEARASGVNVSYAQKGKLFGFIPVTMNAHVSVDASGNVSVKLPWYHVLVMSEGDTIATSVETRIAAAKSTEEVTVTGEAELNPVEQARITHYVTEVLISDGSVEINVK